MSGMNFNLFYLLCGFILGFFIGTQFELYDKEDDDEISKEEKEKHKKNS